MKVCALDGCDASARRKFCTREHQLAARAAGVKPDGIPMPPVHIVIPDTQVKEGVPNDHLQWIGRYIADEYVGKPVTIVHLGDHWDLPSLSSYDKKGGTKMEGRRYQADIAAGNWGFRLLDAPITALSGEWKPRKVFLFGNHEHRISRAVENDAQLEGMMSLRDCDTLDWERHDFLVPVTIDGVVYAHYFYNPMSGRPYAGENLKLRLKTQGHTFTQGHQQTFDYAIRFVNGAAQHGLVVGACYQHDEDYKGPQGNAHWRGIIVKHQVEDGNYDIMPVSLDYLCRRYEGHRLAVHEGREL
jgi:hypothetical protein